MLISVAWLRELVPVAADDAEIARRLTARGLTVDAVDTSAGTTVFDIDVPANRPDALGHLGVAREVAAAFAVPLPATPAPEVAAGQGAPAGASVSVVVEDASLCGRYTARIVRGVRVGPSPDWVVARLSACGLRSINNVVDASNLVMLELGQPVHFFDLARIAGATIHVRASREGERLTTLDGVERTLTAGMIVIADADSPVALGGVMGGAFSEITDATRDILIEAAWFSPAPVRFTARAVGLSTDASARFERGCDPEAGPAAQALAVRLLSELAGGTAAPGMIDVRPSPASPKKLSVRLSRARRLLGYEVSSEEARLALSQLGLAPAVSADAIEVTVPSFRVDLEREADLVEEIGRHLGYDRIPVKSPQETEQPAAFSMRAQPDERVRDRLNALGFSEAFNYAMIGPGEDDAFVPPGTAAPLALANPIAETMGFLRRSLLPGLLRATDQNVRRGATDVRLFELGSVFHARVPGQLPDEPLYAGFAWTGAATPPHWTGTSRAADAWDGAGLVEDLLATAFGEQDLRRERPELPGFHPGRSILWRDGLGRRAAWCGSLHPDQASGLGVSAEVWLGEIDLALVSGTDPAPRAYRTIPRFPGMWRDLSIVLDPGASAGDVLAALASVPSPAPVTMTWLDRYSGPPLQDGQAAMTLRVMLQPPDRTLTDAEAETYRTELAEALVPVPGVRLRRIDT
jgi:phenylalanyl-tRNA synthetase beta chain